MGPLASVCRDSHNPFCPGPDLKTVSGGTQQAHGSPSPGSYMPACHLWVLNWVPGASTGDKIEAHLETGLV